MADFMLVLLRYCVLVFAVLIASTSGHLTGFRHRDKHMSINQATLPDPEQRDTSQNIHLPQFLSLGIKYHFTKSWRELSTPDNAGSICTKEETDVLHKCHISRLYDALDGGMKYEKSPALKDTDFNKALDQLCGYYSEFVDCLQRHRLRKCFQDERTVVEVLYSYTCGVGKQELTASNTGQCLSTITVSSVMEVVKETPACVNTFSDLSSSILVMFSQYHDHNLNTSLELVPMKENLVALCRSWYIEEKCMIPVYARKCGPPARRFYVGLLNYIKTTLAADYRRYGSELSHLALCQRNTGKKLITQARKGPDNISLRAYLVKQYMSLTASEAYYRTKFGQCNPLTTLARMIKCFWHAIYEAGNGILSIISDFASHHQALVSLFKDFSHCYDDFVEECRPEDKVNFANLIDSICNLTSNREARVDCLDAVGLLEISGEKCGMTLSEIIQYYLFQSSRIYDSEIFLCTNVFSKLHVDFTCLKRQIEGMTTDMSTLSAKPICFKGFMTEVKTFIKNLETVTEEFMAYIKRVKEEYCDPEN